MTVGAPVVADGSGMLEGLKSAQEHVSTAKGIIDQVSDGASELGLSLSAFVTQHAVLLLVVGLAVAGFFVWRAMRSGVADHREGRLL